MDVHVHRAVTAGLRRRGVEVLTAQEADMRHAPDSELLSFGFREGWIIFTNDANFLRLHASGETHSGIVYCHQQTGIAEIIQGLMLIFQVLEPAQMLNHIEYL